MMLAFIAALIQPVAAASPVGFYQSSTHEVGAAIELEPDGKFMYALDYGAVSESAEGTWRAEGNSIRLTATKSEGTSRGRDLATTPLQREGRNLLLNRYGVTVRFVPEADFTLPNVQNKHLEKGN